MEATSANLKKRVLGLQRGPKAKAPRLTFSIFLGDCHIPAMDSADRRLQTCPQGALGQIWSNRRHFRMSSQRYLRCFHGSTFRLENHLVLKTFGPSLMTRKRPLETAFRLQLRKTAKISRRIIQNSLSALIIKRSSTQCVFNQWI